MIRAAAVLLAASMLLLPGCFGFGASEGWIKKDMSTARMEIDLDNCAWDATHKLDADGNVTVLDVSDEEIDAAIDACMKSKGYEWGIPKD